MIDDTQIEEATERQLNNLGSYGLNEDELDKIGSMVLYREEDVKESFKAAINWFLDNLWHNTSEVPDKRKYIIVEYSNKKVSRDAFTPYDIHWLYKDFTGEPWKQLIKNEKITRWLYIDDLFPKKGGK